MIPQRRSILIHELAFMPDCMEGLARRTPPFPHLNGKIVGRLKRAETEHPTVTGSTDALLYVVLHLRSLHWQSCRIITRGRVMSIKRAFALCSKEGMLRSAARSTKDRFKTSREGVRSLDSFPRPRKLCNISDRTIFSSSRMQQTERPHFLTDLVVNCDR